MLGTSAVDVLIFREDAAAFFASPGALLLADAGRNTGAGMRMGAASFDGEIDDREWCWRESGWMPCVVVKRGICEPTQGISMKMMWGGRWLVHEPGALHDG